MNLEIRNLRKTVYGVALSVCLSASCAYAADDQPVFKPGHPSLNMWRLPSQPEYPEGNKPTRARVALGKKLFFDPKLSGGGDMSCGTCHNPALGWSDGLATAKGNKGKVLGRATPTIINTAFSDIMMWDGRKESLEDQAFGPMESRDEMSTNIPKMLQALQADPGYTAMFKNAYPGKPINRETVSMAIASFERTVISNNTAFDRWIRGSRRAMTRQQVRGFKLFVGKAKCDVCHSAPNFTDDSFHNVGLASFGAANADMGRFAIKPIAVLRGAFKTPSLRDIELTAPYFHDGSAQTLMEVVEHYDRGGDVKTNLSGDIKPLRLSNAEKKDLVAFMHALTTVRSRSQKVVQRDVLELGQK